MIYYYLVWIIAIVLAVVAYLREVYSKFSRYGVGNRKPLPFLGNMGGLTFRQYHVSKELQMSYNEFPNERYFGRFEMTKPVVMIRDLDLVRLVTVKDFEHFVDHRTMMDETVDPLFGRNLFCLKGQEWKDMRSTLSPAFTSSKMKAMVPFMIEVNEQMIRVLTDNIAASDTGSIVIDCKDLTTRYATDVIATCAFGVKVDSHSDTNNEFYLRSKSVVNSIFKRILLYLTYSSLPRVLKTLNMDIFNDGEGPDFFKHIVLNTMKDREAKTIIRPDMIHLLMQAKKGKLTHDEKSQNDDVGFATAQESDIDKRTVHKIWSDDDLVAQAVLFFAAGFETVSAAMSFLLYELAINPDVQNRLVEEIREHHAKNNGKFDYTSIQNMKYMDMVITELLRLWPPIVAMDRICVKDYNLGKPNATATSTYTVRKGELLSVPVWCLHRDPEHFENPSKFDPERFSEENKHKIKPYSYLPFGNGPRNCIGSRFALCEVKVMMYQFLQQLEVSPCEKTVVPAELSPELFTLSLKGGNWVRLSLRK